MLRPLAFIRIFSVGLMVLGACPLSSQDYPNKPIRILTSGAGGGNDFASRQIAEALTGSLGQQVIVDNRANGAIAAEAVAKAPADGHSLTVQGASLWLTPLLRKTPYEITDFAPISLVAREIFIVAVHPSLPVKSVKELIALAKAKPGALNYGSSPVGTTTNLAVELFKSMAGINIVHVPYKGSAPAMTALISGEVELMITDAGLVTPHLKSNRLRALAVTSAEPSVLAAGLATVAATGLPGYEATGMTGILASVKTTVTIVRRLNEEIVRFLRTPDAKEKFLNNGIDAAGSSPQELAAAIKSDMDRLGKLVRETGIR